jgi:Bacterial protein of unknown function (DUF937)
MSADSFNLVEMIQEYLPDSFTEKMSSLLGESHNKTQTAIDAGVPGILTGLGNAASTPDGARRLTDAVDGADHNMLSNLGGLLGKTPSSESGFGMIQSILGTAGLSELTGNIGRISGLSGKGVMGLLGYLAPVVFGVLKNVQRTRGLDSAGLLNLLSSQKSNFAAAMPEGMPASEPASYVRGPRDVSSGATGPSFRPAETYRGRREPVGTGSRLWVWPLLIALGLIGLMWYWASRSTTHAGSEANRVTEQTARPGTGFRAGSLEMLRAKYQSVFDEARAQGVQLQSVSVDHQNGRLLVRGTAPSFEAANKVWDQIKRVNPSMDDITADFQVR